MFKINKLLDFIIFKYIIVIILIKNIVYTTENIYPIYFI